MAFSPSAPVGVSVCARASGWRAETDKQTLPELDGGELEEVRGQIKSEIKVR